ASRPRGILRIGPDGLERGSIPSPPGSIDRIAIDHHGTVWLVTVQDDGSFRLWRRGRSGEFVHATDGELARSFEPTGPTAASEVGFCLEDRSRVAARTCCFSWYG